MSLNKGEKYVIGSNRRTGWPSGVDKEKHDKIDYNTEADIEHIESLQISQKVPYTSRAQKAQASLKRHWRRFWCCYLLASIIFLAIFLPVFFVVAIPAIAQRLVDDTDLPIHSAEILDPKIDSVSFTLNTALNLPIKLKVHTDAFDLNLFQRNITPIDPYLTVAMPAFNLKGDTDITVTQDNTKIIKKDQFIQVLTQAVYNKKFTMSAKGSTTGFLGALKVPLTLDKSIELDGLDKLSGFSIDSANLIIPKEADGTNLRGMATLPNHSVFTFELGNVTLNLKSSDLILGQATIENVILRPGNNSVALKGELDIDTIMDNISDIISSQKEALTSGDLQLDASGNATVYNGVHIDYFEEVLNNLTLTARVPILEILGGTLQNLLDDDNNSTLGSLLQNLTSTMSGLSSTNDFEGLSRSIQRLL